MAKPRVDDLPTTEQLRAAFDYDPETGIFTWRYRPDCPVQWNGKWAGRQAGTPSGRNIQLQVNRRRYVAHRIAWCIVYGEFPADMIDHANGDWRDNRIANLRIASRSQNAANSRLPMTNTSGLKGVCWIKRARRWRAQISHNKVHYNIGDFISREEAYKAYCDAALRIYGEFARLK